MFNNMYLSRKLSAIDLILLGRRDKEMEKMLFIYSLLLVASSTLGDDKTIEMGQPSPIQGNIQLTLIYIIYIKVVT